MKANEAVGAMLSAAGISQSDAAKRLGVSRGNVNSVVKGHVGRDTPRGMTVAKLLEYAALCGYSVQLVPTDTARPTICVDGVNARHRRRPAGGSL